MISQNASSVPAPGKRTFIPKMLAMQRERQQDHAEDGQHAQDVVVPVRDHRLVRVLERLDDLLVVVEQVPDALGRVDEVVEVELELLGQEALDVRSSSRSVGRWGLMILRKVMISCLTFEMSRTTSSERPSKTSSSIQSSLCAILSRIGKQ